MYIVQRLPFGVVATPRGVNYPEWGVNLSGINSAAVFWAKEPAELEIINDVNDNLVNFYRVLKADYSALKCLIDQTLHSRREHEFAQLVYEFPDFFDPVRRAWALWVLSKMSFASMLDGSFGYDKVKNSVAKKIQGSKDLFTEALSQRLERTQIECTDALRIIRTRDTENTFHFVDPPYVGTDCGHYAGSYNLMDFQNLLELLETIKGKFMLTMFPHPMLDEFISKNGWKVHQIERTISASKTNRRKQIELIVCNYGI